MAYDPRLDNNYRVSGDRIISERTFQNEAAVGLLADFVRIPPKLQICVGVLGLLTAAGIFVANFSPDVKFDSWQFWLEALVGGALVLLAWLLSYTLAPFILWIGAVYLTYHITESIGLCLVTLIAFPLLANKLTNALERLAESRATPDSAGETDPSARPVVGRGVKIFAAVALGSVALLFAWFVFDSATHPSASQIHSPPSAASTATALGKLAGSGSRSETIGKLKTVDAADIPKTSPESQAQRTSTPPAVSADSGEETVRSFYLALGHGDGDKANALMSLEKRAAPAYQPDAIEAFYGHMAEPLTLVSVSVVGSGEYEVRYRYRKQSAVCNGQAIVTTQDSAGRNLIARIKPLGNC